MNDSMIKVHADGRWMPEDGFAGENLWALRTGPDRAILMNIPFFTQGLNMYDLVKIDSDNEITFVYEDGGQKNLRAIITDGDEKMKEVYDYLEKEIGVRSEGGFNSLITVSTPPTLVQTVTDYFDANDIPWENGN